MPTRCFCRLTDCAYWTAAKPGSVQAGTPPGDCDCHHTDKPNYMQQPCPLYRKEWAKNENKMEELKNRLLKRKI